MHTFRWLAVLPFSVVACYGMLPGDTEGTQRSAEWWSDASLSVEVDSVLFLERVRVHPGTHDVVRGRFEFDPVPASYGDEYSITFGIDLGPADSLLLREPHALGGPEGLRVAVGARIGMGAEVRADSARGTLVIVQRGMMQLIGRVEADFFYSNVTDSARVVVERFRQRVDFLRPATRTPSGPDAG